MAQLVEQTVRFSPTKAGDHSKNRSPDAVGARGCDTDRQAQKSDNINGRMAQLVVPTGTFVRKLMVAWLSW